MGKTTWTPSRVSRLIGLLAEPLSAGIIANKLNGEFTHARLTRSAVIGKVSRLGLQLPHVRGPVEQLSRAHRFRRTRPSLFLRSSAMRWRRPMVVEVIMPKPATELPGCTLLDLTEQLCCWPIGDPSAPAFGYCGRQRAIGPYCVMHNAMAHVPARPRRERAVWLRGSDARWR